MSNNPTRTINGFKCELFSHGRKQGTIIATDKEGNRELFEYTDHSIPVAWKAVTKYLNSTGN